MTIENHTELEKELIKEMGGEPNKSYGVDGTLPDGDPVEVRLAAEEDRFRLNQDTHETMLEENGTYVFDDPTDNIPPNEVPASVVDDRLGEDWHSDRGYMHQFVSVDDFI